MTAPRRTAAPPGRRGTGPLGRTAGPLVLVLAAALFLDERAYRGQEMRGTQWLVGHLLGLRTLLLPAPAAPVLYAGRSGGALDRGIALTTGCSSALLIAPLALVTGLLLLTGTRRSGRLLAALALAAALLAGANLGRLTLIVAAQHHYGEPGFGWTHTLVGSLLMTGAALLALLCYLVLAVRTPAPRTAEETAP